MADPTIQTFCCYRNNKSDNALMVMREFDTSAYNTVCMLSSLLGIVGAVYQILPREEFVGLRQWYGFSSTRNREIVFWLTFADLLAALGVFVRSVVWLHFSAIMPIMNQDSSVTFCVILSAWTEYFYMSTWIWTLCYAVDMKLFLGQKPGHPRIYHLTAWVCPAILTSVGLSILYLPDAKCHDLTSVTAAIFRILPNYCATYILLATVMIVNPILYMLSSNDFATAVTCSMAQMTNRERKLVQAVKLKFAMTNLVYYICWTPNLVNGILLWIMWFRLPAKLVVVLWYIMATLNPLQAFFNAFVYKKWGRSEKIRLNWYYSLKGLATNGLQNLDSRSEVDESTSLLSPHYKLATSESSYNRSSSI